MKRATVVLFCALTAAGLWGSTPAGAHDGKAVISVEASALSGDTSGEAVSYRVRVVWDNDGHPAKDATVTAVALSAGVASTPVPMAAVDADGRYAATVTFESPGDWTVRFTVISPPGTLEVAQSVSAPATTTSTTVAVSTTVANSSSSIAAAVPASSSGGGAKDSSAGTGVFIAVIAVIAAGGGVLAIRARRGRRTR